MGGGGLGTESYDRKKARSLLTIQYSLRVHKLVVSESYCKLPYKATLLI